MRNYIKQICLATAAVACFCMLSAGPCTAAESQKLFDVDVKKQKAVFEKDLAQAAEFLSQTKLQNARGQVDLLDHKLKLLRPDLSKEEAAAYQTKIDNVTTRIGAKEDSCIKVTMDILHVKGVDPALAYLQNDLRMFGVSEKKTSAAEKTILEEAPKIQQSLERQAIERAVKALQTGQALDPDMDPYIVKTAERIIKAHADSVAAVESAKARKELEEKQRVERIQKEKEEKEKKLEEEKAAKIKQDEEKKKLAEQEIVRKKQEAAEKEKQRLARLEEERQKKILAQEEKALKDSLAAAQKAAEQLALQEKERQNKLSAQQKEQERAARAEEERKKQELAQQEKARKESLAAAQKDSLAAAQKQQVQLAAARKSEKAEPARPAAQKQPPQQPVEQKPAAAVVPPAQPSIASRRESPEAEARPPVISKEAQDYLQGLKDNRKKAQDMVMTLYDLVDKKRVKEALEKFKQDRSFIAQYVDAQVFNVLEQTIAQSVAATPETATPSPVKPAAARVPEQEEIDKINSFMQDNKIEAAYGEFKRTQSSLRHFMTHEDFRQLKEMVENAYKIRKQGK
jgi:hypothetical protein